MEFDIVEDSFVSNKKYVWYKGLCLGNIVENDNSLNREKYIAVAYPDSLCGAFPSKEAAVFAVYEKHQANKPNNAFERVVVL